MTRPLRRAGRLSARRAPPWSRLDSFRQPPIRPERKHSHPPAGAGQASSLFSSPAENWNKKKTLSYVADLSDRIAMDESLRLPPRLAAILEDLPLHELAFVPVPVKPR